MTDTWTYVRERVYLSMAGSGNPWGAFTSLRKQILRVLHDFPDLTDAARVIGISESELENEIQPLIEASLAKKVGNRYRPTFLVTNENETSRVFSHANDFGEKLARSLINQWEEIVSQYYSLSLSALYSFDDVAFFLVGGRLLDIGLLEYISKGSLVMPPAPARPSPDRPDARYYFWMIEGGRETLGTYGQDDTDLKWKGWHYVTFGQNVIDDEANPARAEMDKRYSEVIDNEGVTGPEELAERLDIPIYRKGDSEKWTEIAERYCKQLVDHYIDNRENLVDLHSSLQAESYAPDSVGEFICCYAHIAYSSAIDTLASEGVLKIPPEKYQAAIWFRENDLEGLTAGLSESD